jgi:DNA-binding transcriptional regulator YiaG
MDVVAYRPIEGQALAGRVPGEEALAVLRLLPLPARASSSALPPRPTVFHATCRQGFPGRGSKAATPQTLAPFLSRFRTARFLAIRSAHARSDGMTQAEFAQAIGISVHTLRNWEQGRRKPEGPAVALLRIAARHPRILRENLESAP